MAEPSKLPVWATDSEAKIVEPAEVKKQAGWVHEIPPAEWFNWWMNNVYKWILHFKETLVTIASGISTNAGNIDTLETDVGSLETAVDTLETAVGTVSYGNFDAVFPDSQFDTAQTVNIKYKKEILSNATVVTLFLPKLFATPATGSNTLGATGTPVPATIRPTGYVYVPIELSDHNNSIGCVRVEPDGELNFLIHTVGASDNIVNNSVGFSDASNKGFYQSVVSYLM